MKTIATGKLKEQNDYKISDYLSSGNEVTKRELSNKTGLTFAIIGNILNHFLSSSVDISMKWLKEGLKKL